MKEEKEKIPFGVAEWGKSANYVSGCQNDCKYCYAKQIAIRFGRKTPATWINEDVNHKSLNQKFKKIEGKIMFPSTSDITPTNLNYSIQFLKNMLSVGNEVLIVTKPRLDVVKALCSELIDYKDKIIFRFTIGSTDSEVLKFWEPGASDFQERKQSVIHAFEKGFQTSLSCEPMLDDKVEGVVNELQNYITETIWVGKMNFLKSRLAINGHADSLSMQKADELIAMQSDDKILELYHRLKGNPKIQWKESVKKVLIKNDIVF